MVGKKYSLTLSSELVEALKPFMDTSGYTLTRLIEMSLEDLLMVILDTHGYDGDFVKTRRIVRRWLGQQKVPQELVDFGEEK